MEGAVDVPGLPPVPPSSFPQPVMDRKNPHYTRFVYHDKRFAVADGVIVNTAAELERSALAAITDGRCTPGIRPPTVYPIGPVIHSSRPLSSRTTPGLERKGHRFLWVKELTGGGEEGRKVREKAMEMKAACRNAVEEGGSSDAALHRLAEQLYKSAVVGGHHE
ncbi:hypothetical protein C2845_PM11G17510 [Panicum miliaceum]|uniref:Uncharacterized protein n=1 Tax=Panicum miliaceum TaxID=4540 RepID=A0A3L6RPE5_PANMI|nr:hypothetical protein C2845_PM11G17510 [Panicum miliaceum]